jgi:branched-chain amino acid transport system permease protein
MIDISKRVTARGCIWFGAVVVLITLPFFLSPFWVRIASEIICYSLFAMSFNLVLGYGGMISFGHSGFYGAGAYVTAILLSKTTISLPVALLLAVLFSSFIGLVIGFFSVRLRAFYMAILTLAFGQLVWAVIFKWYTLTGGENGIIGVSLPSIISTPNSLYLFILCVTLAAVYLLHRITDSPFGRILLAMRDDTLRTEFIGINVQKYRLITFVISTFFAGLSGGFFALISGGAFPDLAYWGKSGEVLLSCVLGGMNVFLGPAVGSALIILLDQLVTGFTDRWPMVMGVVFIFVVLFMPQGVTGYIREILAPVLKRKRGLA